jgi:hypothetical protein
MTDPTPADYASRLTRLPPLGVGEGVPDSLIIGIDPPDTAIGAIRFDGCVGVLPDDITTRILESCLRDALIGCPAVLFRQEDRLIHIVTAEDAYSHVYLGRCLLDAADAVITHLTSKETP